MKHQRRLCGCPYLRSDCVGTQRNRSSISIRHLVQISQREAGRSGQYGGWGGLRRGRLMETQGLCNLYHAALWPPIPASPISSDFLPLPPDTAPSALEGRGRGEEPLSRGDSGVGNPCRTNPRRAACELTPMSASNPRLPQELLKTPWSIWPAR